MSNEWVSYDVIPNVNGCSGSPVSFVVTVFPVANVIFNPPGQTLCSGGSTAINLTSGVTGTTFTWTASGSNPSVTGYLAGNGNIISQTLNNSGYLPGSVTYVVLPTANGCPGTNGSVMVTLNPLPQVTFVACSDPVVTTANPAITLAGGTPAGGTYSGPGVSAGQFLPGIAGTGTHLILYTYSNTWGCSSSGTHSITVIPSVPFTCGSTLTDPRDNQSYPTVQIGSQCWMAANLNYGTVIASNMVQRDNCAVEKYCFGDNPVNCTGHGGLYQWDELMNYSTSSGTKGLCPPEWHIPAEAEWNSLFTFYTSSGFAGSPLKYSGFSGFDAFLSGVRFNDVKWDFNNFAVLFWSSTARGSRKAWAHGMNEQNPSVSYYPSHRNNAFPVRCVKD